METNELSQRTWLAIGLVAALGVGIVMLLLGVGVLAGPGAPATLTPPPTVGAAIWLSPTEGGPGTVVAVAGAGWQPGDTVMLRLSDLSAGGDPSPLTTATVGTDGRFVASFVFPSDPRWAGPATVLIIAWSPATGLAAPTPFRVLELPTPVATPTTSLTAIPTAPPPPGATATPFPPTATAPPPPPSPTPLIGGWRGEYYGTRDLTGAPLLVRSDPTIDFAWGSAAPATGLPADNFSVRWTQVLSFDGGVYRFHVVVDDGVRLYVDETLAVDSWVDGAQRELTADRALSSGNHSLRVEYYERSGQATIRIWWERIAAYPDWRGDYWPNRTLSGNPTLTRNDAMIDFDWGAGAPATGLPTDGFSARWTRNAGFEMGTYRFHVVVDDGARMWVDDRLLVDSWHDGGARELTADYALTQGTHSLRVEYYENTGQATIRVWWERLASPPYPDWRGEYWPNRTLGGNPVLVRNDPAIDFRWGTGSPAVGLPVDDFSIRWSRTVTFTPGVYVFYAWSDDGIRFYLDGGLLMDEWHSSSGQTVYAVSATLTGPHALVVEYYEHIGNALVRFWWVRSGDWPTATPPPLTLTPTPPPTLTPTPPPTLTPTPPPTLTPTLPPTLTPTPEPPTATPPNGLPTATPEPPTATPTPLPPTATPLPSTPTALPVRPSLTPTLPPARLSELLSVPRRDWNRDGAVNDGDEWIELVNSRPVTVDLGGWSLETVPSLQPPYRIPTGTLLSPGGYAVFYRQQTGVALSDLGSELRLRDAGNAVVDRVLFPPLAGDSSYSRDAAGGWHANWPPSPGQPNQPPAVTPTPRATPRWRFPIRLPWP